MQDILDKLFSINFFSLRDDYLFGISGMQKHLVKYTAVNKYLFIAELVGANKEIRPKMVNNFRRS